MAKQINQERCIQCNACLPESPSEGVTVYNAVFVVDPRLCAECAGMYLRSLYSDVCPTGAVEETTPRETNGARSRRAPHRNPDRSHRD